VDSQYGTPGALDNAAGVTVLLGLLERLAGYRGPHALELVPLNGEDDFAIPGQRDWLARNERRLEDILLGMNVDGAGFAGHPTAVSFYGCPPRIRAAAEEAMAPLGLVEGPPWPQGDHSILALNGVPALAVTSTGAFFVASTVAHTERDVPALVDPEALAAVVRFFAEVIERLGTATA
jgi:aminopeptidase YwaD